jgi:hypothetical protein
MMIEAAGTIRASAGNTAGFFRKIAPADASV